MLPWVAVMTVAFLMTTSLCETGADWLRAGVSSAMVSVIRTASVGTASFNTSSDNMSSFNRSSGTRPSTTCLIDINRMCRTPEEKVVGANFCRELLPRLSAASFSRESSAERMLDCRSLDDMGQRENGIQHARLLLVPTHVRIWT